MHQFVVNYANSTKGFTRLLKKDTPFLWDERAHESFDALKKSLTSAPLVSPLDYSRYFFLNVVVSQEMVGMVLVQEHGMIHDHVIYYLN